MKRHESRNLRDNVHSRGGNRAHRHNLRNINRAERRRWREDLKAEGGAK